MVKDSTVVDVPDLIGTVHPQYRDKKLTTVSLKYHIESLLREQKVKRILGYLGTNAICTIILIFWCVSTNSIALAAYTSLTVFDFLSIFTILVTIWVKKQEHSFVYSFGYERFEVLFVFATTVLTQFGAFFIIKESFERLVVEQPDIHTSRLLPGTMIVFLFHIISLYALHNPSFEHVIHASTSSWLQEHVSDMSESLCHVLPGLSKILLPRINPLSLVAVGGALSLAITHLSVQIYGYHSMDTWAAIWIATITCATMFPMSSYTGKILLQTTPAHLIGQLDKCLREASTLDGVLEFRNEHFWTVSFGRLAGSVHVRIRRDADEQMVLAHVFHRLSNLVPMLNVHIFKDDWLRLLQSSSHYNPVQPTTSTISTLSAYPPNLNFSNNSKLLEKVSPVAYNSINNPPYNAINNFSLPFNPSNSSFNLPTPNLSSNKVSASSLPTVEMLAND